MHEELTRNVRLVVENSPEIVAACRQDVFVEVMARVDVVTASLNRRPRDFINYVKSLITEILNATPTAKVHTEGPRTAVAEDGVPTTHAACCGCAECNGLRYMV